MTLDGDRFTFDDQRVDFDAHAVTVDAQSITPAPFAVDARIEHGQAGAP